MLWQIISNIIVAIITYSLRKPLETLFLAILSRLTVIEIELNIENPKPIIYGDICVIPKTENDSFILSVTYNVRKRRLTELLSSSVKYVLLNLYIGMDDASISFSLKNGITDKIAIPLLSTGTTRNITCNISAEEGYQSAELIPVQEIVFKENLFWLKRMIAKLLLKIEVKWIHNKTVYYTFIDK